jgi:hypothetical protein
MQDLWAQAMERLADRIGREIRYGGTPKTDVAEFGKLMEVAKHVSQLEQWLDQRQGIQTWTWPPPRHAGVAGAFETIQRILAEIDPDSGGRP